MSDHADRTGGPSLTAAPTWEPTSSDPNDEQFGDVVRSRDGDPTPALASADVALLGEPFDEAVVGRRGARHGPDALREALASVKTHHFTNGTVGEMLDLGDVAFDGESRPAVSDLQRAVEDFARHLHDSDAFPVFLGGDNSLTYPNVAPLLDSDSVGVLNVDAHLDVREVHDDPTSGTPYRQLLEDGLAAYACVGARHFETTGEYAAFVDEHDGVVVTSEAVGRSLDDALDRALAAMGGVDTLYVSVDLDVLDAAHAPGVSAPTPGGLSTRELFALLRRIGADDRLAGFEVVECAPPLDREELTARAGARAIAHLLAGRRDGTLADASGVER
ncbi:formimidoylglutamase [Halomarina oriensis]|uniref:Formimidoylglutamase n=1 Tax=Halomarina oriensis TaxID=671145 RepID=A0A6B0GM57_9EURY|nr:formimidoylglutamase [Halomarina oriensis]MWG34569.1 formimidoylglutamase [Halomarina oriensis]